MDTKLIISIVRIVVEILYIGILTYIWNTTFIDVLHVEPITFWQAAMFRLFLSVGARKLFK